MGWTRLGPFLDLSCCSHVPLTRDHAPLNSGSLHVLSPSSFCQEDASVFHFLPSLSDETSQHRQLSSWKTSLTPLFRFDVLFSVSVASFASPSQDRMHCILSSVLVQFAKSCPSLCDPRDCSMLGLPVPDYLPEFPKFMSIELLIPPTISFSPALFSSCLQSFPNRVFPNESTVCIRWPKCWSFSFRIRLSNKYSRLISFSTDWFYLLATQRIIKSLFLQHHNLKASILWHSAFFKVQLSHLYVTTGKTITLTKWIFFGKVMSLFFNMLSRFVITFLPRSKRLLISWLQSLSSMIFLSPGCLSISPFPTARS